MQTQEKKYPSTKGKGVENTIKSVENGHNKGILFMFYDMNVREKIIEKRIKKQISEFGLKSFSLVWIYTNSGPNLYKDKWEIFTGPTQKKGPPTTGKRNQLYRLQIQVIDTKGTKILNVVLSP